VTEFAQRLATAETARVLIELQKQAVLIHS
jgi:hypothetical protein